MRYFLIPLAALLLVAPCALAARTKPNTDIKVRVRPLRVEPKDKVRILWRHGGEGLGGDVTSGEFTAVKPQPPSIDITKEMGMPGANAADELGLGGEPKSPQDDITVEETKTFNLLYLPPKAWSPAVPYSSLRIGTRNRFLTITPQGLKHGTDIDRFDVEVEFSYRGKVVASVIERGTAGPVVGIYVPGRAIDAGGKPTADFAKIATGITGYTARRREFLTSLPWADMPTPQRFALPNHLQGFGLRRSFGVRSSSAEAMINEFESLMSMGCNSLAFSAQQGGKHWDAAQFLATLKRPDDTAYLDHFKRIGITHFPGYPVPAVNREGRSENPIPPPGAGCPYYPDRSDPGKAMEELLAARVPFWTEVGFPEVKGQTVDEIGSVFDGSGERKSHMAACKYCREGFRDFLRSLGLKPKDFGTETWDPIMPVYGYGTKTWAEQEAEKKRQVAEHKEALEKKAVGQWFGNRKANAEDAARLLSTAPKGPSEAEETDEDADTVIDKSDDEAKRRGGKTSPDTKPERTPVPISPAAPRIRQSKYAGGAMIPLSDEGTVLLYYYSRLFNCHASAMLFTPQTEVIRRWNARKRAALDRGEVDTPAASQPWIYCGAMRGNTYLMGGHSLDFFNFYRLADNLFTYETSNRDARVWIWDGLLCNLGRVLMEKGLVDKCSIYIKPHRGAVLQRTLQAAATGFTCMNWYCYGPDWAKGDDFSGSEKYLKLTSKASRLLAAAEEVLYDCRPAEPAQVALLRPRTSEFFGGSASWEDGKWVYVALTHGQIPVDPIDEGFVLSEDLSRYKAIYVTGSHVRADASRALAEYVKNGGHLFTDGWGLARDEADRPLNDLLPVFGLEKREQMYLWANVRRYGATSLAELTSIAAAPEGARIADGDYPLAVGREVLHAAEGTEVLARYADGGAAVTRHAYGKGTATVCGFYAGVEYSADVLGREYDQSTDFNAAKRAAITRVARDAGVEPVVDTGVPTVEGDLVVNPTSGRKVVVLTNWAYRPGRVLVPAKDLAVSVRADGVTKARSAWARKDLPAERRDGRLVIRLDAVEEGDVLLLE